MNFNLGIGTTSPSARFELLTAGTSASIGLRIRDNAGTDRLSMLDNGNVGIGDTAPQPYIQAKGTIRMEAEELIGSNRKQGQNYFS